MVDGLTEMYTLRTSIGSGETGAGAVPATDTRVALSGGVSVDEVGGRSSREQVPVQTGSAQDVDTSIMAGGLTEMHILDCNFPKTIPECWAECERLGTAPALLEWCAAFPELTQVEARVKEYAFMADLSVVF